MTAQISIPSAGTAAQQRHTATPAAPAEQVVRKSSFLRIRGEISRRSAWLLTGAGLSLPFVIWWLWTALGLADPMFNTRAGRRENISRLYEIITPWFADKTRDEIQKVAQAKGVPFGPIFSPSTT